MSTPTDYRNDIDGLRAISVIAVVLYHLNPAYAPGGFVGVDVFFVISGFLISKYIYANAYRGSFSIVEFYERRARRILPAYAAVSALAALAAYFILLPDDLVLFARSLVATTLFAGNIYFWATTDYFAQEADTAPLLHYWSLGVEEQFYILFPLLIILVARYSPRLIPLAVGLALVVSLAAAELTVGRAQPDAFYLPHLRAWELLVGSVLALPLIKRPRSALISGAAAGAGVLMIVAAIALFETSMRFPGASALLPCMGAALVLWAGSGPANVVSAGLSIRPMQLIGLISYSLYLVHWPIIVFSNELFPYINTLASHLLEAALAVGLATASYWCIERPVRTKRAFWSRPKVFALAGVAVAGVASLGAVFVASNGFPGRLSPEAQRLLAYSKFDVGQYRRGICFGRNAKVLKWDECVAGGPDAVILWGDSFAAHHYPGLSEVMAARGMELGQITASACQPLFNEPRQKPDCREFNDRAFAEIQAARPAAVILSANWTNPINRLDNTIAKLRSVGIPAIVLGPSPRYLRPLPSALAQRVMTGGAIGNAWSDADRSVISLDMRMQQRFAGMPGASYVSLLDTACPDRRCPATVDGAPMTWDRGHLTIEASRMFMRAVADQLPRSTGTGSAEVRS